MLEHLTAYTVIHDQRKAVLNNCMFDTCKARCSDRHATLYMKYNIKHWLLICIQFWSTIVTTIATVQGVIPQKTAWGLVCRTDCHTETGQQGIQLAQCSWTTESLSVSADSQAHWHLAVAVNWSDTQTTNHRRGCTQTLTHFSWGTTSTSHIIQCCIYFAVYFKQNADNF